MKTIPKSLLVALFLSLTVAIAPSIAAACGSYALPTDEELVERTILRHASALRQGDTQGLRNSWTVDAGHSKTLVAVNGTQKVRSEPIDKAFVRWAKSKDTKMSMKIESLDVDQQAAFAKLSITWNGQKRIEYLTLLKVDGRWTLVGKVHVSADGSIPQESSGKRTASLY